MLKKGFKFFLVLISVFVIDIIHVDAANSYAYSVGTNYNGTWPWEQGNGDSSTNAIKASNVYRSIGFSSSYNIEPTSSNLLDKNSNGKYKMESSMLFFNGHANSTRMSFNYKQKGGNYKTGIWNGDAIGNASDYTYVGIGQFNMSEVDLFIMAGCKTANGFDNIAKYAVDRGARTSIGWTFDIEMSSTNDWLDNFYIKLKESGSTVVQAVNYANSKSYSDNSVKNAKIYGNLNLNVSDRFLVSRTGDINNISNNNDNDVSITLSQNYDVLDIYNAIDRYLKKTGVIFDKENFIIEINNFGDQTIYDLRLVVDDVYTTLGYTIIVQNNKIINIYDNTNGVNINTLKSTILNLNKKNITTDLYSSAVQKSKQDIIIENNMSINYKIDTQKEYYYYDTKDSKLYFVIRSTVIDADDDTRFVIDSKTEIN